MRRILRFIDWRFMLSLTVLLLVTSLALSARATSIHNDRLIEQARRDHAATVAERAAAADEREALLAGQADLQRKYDDLLAQQEALVEWLRGRGISVPPYVLRGRTDSDADSDDHDDGSSSTSEGSGKQSPPKSDDTKPPSDDKPDTGSGGGDNGSSGGSDRGRGSDASGGRSDARAGNADDHKPDK